MTNNKPKLDAQATAIADMFNNNTKTIQHTDALDMNADTTKSKPEQIDI